MLFYAVAWEAGLRFFLPWKIRRKQTRSASTECSRALAVVSPVVREIVPVCSQRAISLYHAIPRICVLGQEYTTFKWYLGKKTNDAQLARATDNGFTRALEFWGGDSKTLMVRGLSAQLQKSHQSCCLRAQFAIGLGGDCLLSDACKRKRVCVGSACTEAVQFPPHLIAL